MRNLSVRKTLGVIHLWVGLILCLPLMLLGITGTILALQDNSGPTIAASGPARPVAAIIAAAARSAPEGQKPSLFVAPPAADKPAAIRFSVPGRGGPGFGAQVFVDPSTLAVTQVAGSGFMRQVHMLHGNLLFGREGRDAVGWLGVVMLAMGVSGLVIWWPRPGRWRAAFSVASKARGVRFYRELHGAAGIWGLIVLIAVSFSGVYLAFPETVGSALAVADARSMPQPKVQPVQGAKAIDADQAIAIAEGAVRGTLKSIGLPQRPDQPYRVALAHAGNADGAPMVTVFVEPWTAQVIEVRDPTASGATAFLAWQRAIHTGEGLGWFWHVLVALSGLLPALFAVTGVSMWILKRRAQQRMATARSALPEAAE
jgi:uncharacterized iron-regulated membrane protein